MTNKNAAPAFNEGDETNKDTNLRIVPLTGQDEPGDSIGNVAAPEKITSASALERINTISEVPRLAKFARTLDKHGLIQVAKGVPYYQEGAMTPATGVEESQAIITALLDRKKYLASFLPPSSKPANVSKSTDVPIKKNEEELQKELIEKAITSLPVTKDQKELEVRAYALHQAGIITKINTDRGYAVRAVEGVEKSQTVVDLISRKKKEFHVNNLIKQVEKADNKQDVLKVFRQAVIRCFLNEDRTHRPDVPGSAQLLQTIEYKMKTVKREKPLTSSISEAIKKF